MAQPPPPRYITPIISSDVDTILLPYMDKTSLITYHIVTKHMLWEQAVLLYLQECVATHPVQVDTYVNYMTYFEQMDLDPIMAVMIYEHVTIRDARHFLEGLLIGPYQLLPLFFSLHPTHIVVQMQNEYLSWQNTLFLHSCFRYIYTMFAGQAPDLVILYYTSPHPDLTHLPEMLTYLRTLDPNIQVNINVLTLLDYHVQFIVTSCPNSLGDIMIRDPTFIFNDLFLYKFSAGQLASRLAVGLDAGGFDIRHRLADTVSGRQVQAQRRRTFLQGTL